MLKKKDIKNIKIAGRAVDNVLQKIKEAIHPGMSGKKLEEIALKAMKENKVKSSILGYKGFPATICVSVNNQLTHGIPDNKQFKRGDLVSFDVACNYRGMHADAASTVIVDENEDDKERKKLLAVTREALDYAIEKIQLREKGFWTIKDLGGHGIGSLMHLDPFIPNFDNGDKTVIEINNAYCIEPLVQMKDSEAKTSNDGWTVVTESLSSHFEDTILVTERGIENLTNQQWKKKIQ